MRSIIGLAVFRPATVAEIMAGFKYFVTKKKPTVLAVTKTKISNVKYSTVDKAEKGGYVIYETKRAPKIEIFATGTEVYLAIEVADAELPKNLENLGKAIRDKPSGGLKQAAITLFEAYHKEQTSLLVKVPKTIANCKKIIGQLVLNGKSAISRDSLNIQFNVEQDSAM